MQRPNPQRSMLTEWFGFDEKNGLPTPVPSRPGPINPLCLRRYRNRPSKDTFVVLGILTGITGLFSLMGAPAPCFGAFIFLGIVLGLGLYLESWRKARDTRESEEYYNWRDTESERYLAGLTADERAHFDLLMTRKMEEYEYRRQSMMDAYGGYLIGERARGLEQAAAQKERAARELADYGKSSVPPSVAERTFKNYQSGKPFHLWSPEERNVPTQWTKWAEERDTKR